MKPIMKKCETCEGLGLVKIDTLGEVHTADTDQVWCEEAQEFLSLHEEICPDCLGLGEIDISDDIEDDIVYQNRKENQCK
jgi:DnaJ-class molecular chaperone